MEYRVSLLKGDGIGPEVTDATRAVLAAAGAPIVWEEVPAGAGAFETLGDPMPAVTLESIRRNRLALKGPLATAKGGGYRSANVTLRQELDLYVGLRPVRSLPGVPAAYTGVDLVVLRENTEDLYAGIEHGVTPGMVLSLKVSTRRAGERIARWAFEYMRHHGRRRIHCCHKAPVNPLADGAFLDAFYSIGADFPFLDKRDLPVDTLAFELALDPSRFDVVLLQNLYGDILSRSGRRARRGDSAWCRGPTWATTSRCSRRCTEPRPTSPARVWRTRSPCSCPRCSCSSTSASGASPSASSER